MDNDLFRVKPVTRYDDAKYFAAPVEETDDAVTDEKPHPLMVLMTFVLVLGLSFGLVGCYMRSEYTPDPPDQPDADPPDPPLPPDCEDGEVTCTDGETVAVCDDGEWASEDCQDLCVEALGADGFSMGCDADAEYPCQCQYDIIEGFMEKCMPDDTYCIDGATLSVCEDGWPQARSCDEVCHETHGPEYWSEGCDTGNAENPCNCVYDMIDGGEMWCEPGDLWCEGDEHLGSCDDDHRWTVTSCEEICTAELGPGASSMGCDVADSDDPCQCVLEMS